jgi:hypothetical protein
MFNRLKLSEGRIRQLFLFVQKLKAAAFQFKIFTGYLFLAAGILWSKWCLTFLPAAFKMTNGYQ